MGSFNTDSILLQFLWLPYVVSRSCHRFLPFAAFAFPRGPTVGSVMGLCRDRSSNSLVKLVEMPLSNAP